MQIDIVCYGTWRNICGPVFCNQVIDAYMQEQAYNEATFRIPDQSGWQPKHEVISSEQEYNDVLKTRLPLQHVLGTVTSIMQQRHEFFCLLAFVWKHM